MPSDQHAQPFCNFWRGLAAAICAAAVAGCQNPAALAQEVPDELTVSQAARASWPVAQLTASELKRIAAPEAGQGVATSRALLFAVDDWVLAGYERETGQRVDLWEGDPGYINHINSCTLAASDGTQLVCANSNYPEAPQASSVELFTTAPLRHSGSFSLGPQLGSLTWVMPYDQGWLAGFAHYDARGSEPGRTHRWTTVATFSKNWQRLQSWLLPESVLARMAPRSASGGSVGPDGLLYVTGHDRPEVYALAFPVAGPKLVHLATIQVPFAGQAIDWDHATPGTRVLWGTDRKRRQLIAVEMPVVDLSRMPAVVLPGSSRQD